jgi:hypothetical protein
MLVVEWMEAHCLNGHHHIWEREREREREKERGEIRSGLEMPAAAAGPGRSAKLIILLWACGAKLRQMSSHVINFFIRSYHEFFLASPLLLEWHTFFVLLKVFPLCRLKVEPRVRKGLYMGQESLDKRMELVLE